MSNNQKQPSNPMTESMELRSGNSPAPVDAPEVRRENADNSRLAETATLPAIRQREELFGEIVKRLLEETSDEDFKDYLSRLSEGPRLRDYRYSSYQKQRDDYLKTNKIKFNNTSSRTVQEEDDIVSFGKETSVLFFPYEDDSEGVGRPRRLKLKVKDALSGYVPSTLTTNPWIRWVHLPANNMSWVESLMKALHQDQGPQEGRTDSYDKDILTSKYWKGRQFSHDAGRHHARFMRPTAMELPANSSGNNAARNDVNTVFFMPYIHWETDTACCLMKYLISNIDEERKAGTHFTEEEVPKLPCSADEKLVRKYLHAREPLHIRRTLDQAFYHTLQDTSARDRDQVVLRYTRDHPPLGEDDPPILMVDQCWIWVLGDTVVSCFPECWVEDGLPEDPIGVLESLVIRLETSYVYINSPHDLASLIVLHCSSNLLGRTLDKEEKHNKLHFLDWFHLSLKEMTTKQTDLFEEFSERTARRQNALEKMILADNAYDSKGTPRPADYWEWKKDVEVLQGPTREGLFDISEEIVELRLIKDIIDELSMIEDVLKQQKRALEMLEGLPYAGPIYRPSMLLPKLVHRKITIEGLQIDARQVYNSVLHLLDLKQKQANVSEARLARSLSEQAAKQAEETTRQGVSIMLFTTVTIIFLPISTIASIFGLNAAELNNGNIGIRVVFAYLFPISLLVITISFLLAFHRAAQLFFALYLEIGFAYIDETIGYSSFMEKKMQEWDKRRYDLKVRYRKTAGSRASGLGTSINALITRIFRRRLPQKYIPETPVEGRNNAIVVDVQPPSEGSSHKNQGDTATSLRPRVSSYLRSLLSWRTRNKVEDPRIIGSEATQSV